MATSLPSPVTTYLKQNPKFSWFSPLRPISKVHISLTNLSTRKPSICSAFLGGISEDLLKDATLHIDESLALFPFLKSGLLQFESVFLELPEVEKWLILIFGGFSWLYLTARPGVLIGAIDAYLLAPLQLGFDSFLGRRNLKRTDFVVGDRLGEGSFGVVYSGVIVPKNVSVQDRVQKRGRALELDSRFKEKVILKKVDHFLFK